MQASSSSPKATEPVKRELITLEHELDLPVATDFVSKPPQVSLTVALELNEESRPMFNARPGERERRLREKVTVPFVL